MLITECRHPNFVSILQDVYGEDRPSPRAFRPVEAWRTLLLKLTESPVLYATGYMRDITVRIQITVSLISAYS